MWTYMHPPRNLRTYIQNMGNTSIILMDILLEQENGISLARRIQDQYPDTQVIFFTGYLEQAENIFGANPAAFLVRLH